MNLKPIIEELHYDHKLRIQDIADKLCMSPVTVSNWLEHGRPNERKEKPLPPDPAPLPPHVGPPNDRLFKQGVCKGCEIPLFGGDPIEREWCGDCDPRGRLL